MSTELPPGMLVEYAISQKLANVDDADEERWEEDAEILEGDYKLFDALTAGDWLDILQVAYLGLMNTQVLHTADLEAEMADEIRAKLAKILIG